jgi:hypothetical protein
MLRRDVSDLLLDLRDVTFIDMHGVRSVETVVRGAVDRGCRTRVAIPSACPRIITGLLCDGVLAQGAIVTRRPAEG